MSCCQKNIGVRNGNGGNGAASMAPTANPPVQPIFSTQSSSCSGGAVVGNAPYLVTPDDYLSLPPIASVPVIRRLGRQDPNNQYVFSAPPSGVIQIQSPKVGRY